MAHLIDKDALVAEIERRKNICKKVVWDLRTQENKDYYQGKAEAYKETIDILDTLEVKEVGVDFGDPKSIWHDARKSVPENGQWILCLEEGGYPRLSNMGILTGTTKWAFVDDLMKA